MIRLWLLPVFVWVGLGILSGCSDHSGAGPEEECDADAVGSLACACRPDGTCDEGLVCVEWELSLDSEQTTWIDNGGICREGDSTDPSE